MLSRWLNSRLAVGWVDIVQCAAHQQLGDHRQLLNRQRDIAIGAFQIAGQVRDEDIQRREGFTGMAQQGWRIDARDDGEDVTDRVRVVGVAQASADGGLGDFAEWDIIQRLGWGFRMVGCFFSKVKLLLNLRSYPTHFHMRVAAIRRCGRPGHPTKTRRTRKCPRA
jgi:hypothetical protein